MSRVVVVDGLLCLSLSAFGGLMRSVAGARTVSGLARRLSQRQPESRWRSFDAQMNFTFASV